MSAPMLSDLDTGGLEVKGLPATPTTGSAASSKTYTDAQVTAAKDRANHTGSQTADTISDFNTAVRTNRPDQLAAMAADLNFNGHKGVGVATPGSGTDAANKDYVDTAIANLVSGQVQKGAVKAYVSTNVNISSPGSTIDGITATNGEIYWLGNQSTGSQNGPWTFNGSSSAMTRPANFDTSAEAVLGSYWVVEAGSKADSFVLMTNDSPVTLGTTTITSQVISIAGAAIGRYEATCGAISAGGNWTITHNLGSTSVHVQFQRVSDGKYVGIEYAATDANTITAIPGVALSSGAYKAIVKY